MPPCERQWRDWLLHLRVTRPAIKSTRFVMPGMLFLLLILNWGTQSVAPMGAQRGHAPFLTRELP
jgi:hypothetical protein